MNRRGFIGAIGDDLPSIIPLVIALLLFFSIFSSTLTTFNNRNQVFDQRTETITVARELKGNSMILNVSHFADNCDKVKIRPRAYSFAAAIYPANHPVTEIAAYEDDSGRLIGINEQAYIYGSESPSEFIGTKDSSSDKYFCQYIRVWDRPFTGNERNFIVRYYPVAVQTRDDEGRTIIKPATLALVVW